MDIRFQCPDCKGHAVVVLTDDEANEIRDRIRSEGRSPTLIVKCENDHELLVTLYNLRSGDGLGVRDIVVPHKPELTQKSSGSKEVDWLTKAFGGEG
jgi:hypothetical protein